MALGEFDWAITKKKKTLLTFPNIDSMQSFLVPRYVGDKSGTWAKDVKRDVLPLVLHFCYAAMIMGRIIMTLTYLDFARMNYI